MKLTAIHYQKIALCQADGAPAAPKYIQILPVGAINPNDGGLPWRLDDPEPALFF